MQIKSITIHNFRTILHESFSLENYSLMIGANNAGKSNVIEVIRIFYQHSGKKFIDARDFPKMKTQDEESWIEIEFSLSENEVATLKDGYVLPEKCLKLRKYLRGINDRKANVIYAYEGDNLSDAQFYGAPEVQRGKLGKIIYIPAASKIDDETKLTGPSPLRDILANILGNLISDSRAFEQFSTDFNAFKGELKTEKTEDDKSLTGLEEEINQDIKNWGVEFDLDITPIDEANIIKNLIDYKIIDKQLGEKIDAHQQGQGFQRQLIYTLIKVSSNYKKPSSTAKKKDFSPEFTLYLFEEPEVFLHPSQQDILAMSLHKIAVCENEQVLATSHSPHFVSQNIFNIPSIIHFRRDEEGKTSIGQLDTKKLKEIVEDNQKINDLVKGTKYEVSPDDLKDDMEAIKYFMWLNPDRCCMFFADHVLLVEGTTEKVLFNYLQGEGKIQLSQKGVYVLDCFGKFNFHRFMNILTEMKISHSILFDCDSQSDDKLLHEKIKQLIDESASAFTTKIVGFQNDIEDLLGIDKCQNQRRKPQHVLLRLKEGKVRTEKIDELIEIVNSMID